MKEIKSKAVNLRMKESTWKLLEQLAKKHDRSVSYIINAILEDHLSDPPKSFPIKKK
jgi:predicted DNA-binding protein